MLVFTMNQMFVLVNVSADGGINVGFEVVILVEYDVGINVDFNHKILIGNELEIDLGIINIHYLLLVIKHLFLNTCSK
jgi:hypothetical protein